MARITTFFTYTLYEIIPIYWLELLQATNYITKEEFESVNTDAVEIIKLITSIIKTTKANINN